MNASSAFRELLENDLLIMPAVHDALCAKMAERAGFKAIFSAGYANSASLLGMPDINLLTMTEMVDAARRMSGAVEIPVIADADTGYGNVSNVFRTVREYERAGVAGIIIEDQVSPKRCGHMSEKQVISSGEMVAKIRACLDARRDDDLFIVARTDALSVNGMGEAIDRANLYREAGADMTFVEAVETVDQMRTVIRETDGPHMANMIPGGKTPILTADELRKIGYKVIAYPTVNTYAVAKATLELFDHLLVDRSIEGYKDHLMDFDEFNDLLGLEEIRGRERGYHDG